MHKLEINHADVMRLAIQNEIQRSDESRYDHRLHGILLVAQGFNVGFAGLREAERPGRPGRLVDAALESLDQDLRKPPESFGYSQNLWDGKLLQHHLAHQYDVELGVRQCQRLFRELGFRLRKPRPLIAQADPEAQQAYKKTPLAGGPRRS